MPPFAAARLSGSGLQVTSCRVFFDPLKEVSSDMNDIHELDLRQMHLVGGGGVVDPSCLVGSIIRGWAGGKLLDLAWDAIRDHNESGAAVEFQTGAGAGGGTFG